MTQSNTSPEAPISNPFPVYPVASLRDISSGILEKTVFTEAVNLIDVAVRKHVDLVLKGKQTGLAIPVRGDYGTGKTHLLTFAQATLQKLWPETAGPLTLLSVPATEVPFPEWYRMAVAPFLARLNLPSIFARLLAVTACQVADQVPLTAGVARDIRKDPLEVYRAFREGLLSQTDVERAMLQAVATISPRGSEELRAVLGALAWPSRQEIAIKWLTGTRLEPVERELLGVSRDLDAGSEAEAVLVALAGAVALGGGLFTFIIDEFEHLMADDARSATHRNATAIKRLLEGMAGAKAFVLVAGHWRAWDQLPDFKARFAGQRPVDLVTLTGQEIGKLVCRFSPSWGKRLDNEALDLLAENCGGNIRKVMTTLHQLYADSVTRDGSIGKLTVAEVSEVIQLRAATGGRADLLVEQAARAVGAVVTREEAPLGKLRFDLAVRQNNVLRLVVDIRHAVTTAEFVRMCDDFSIGIGTLRSHFPMASGLLVVTGAFDETARALLDALPAVTVVPGEGANWEEGLRTVVTKVLVTEPQPSSKTTESQFEAEDKAREALRTARAAHDADAAATGGRVEAVDFGADDRAVASGGLVRDIAPSASTSVFGSAASVLDDFSANIQTQAPTILAFLLSLRNLPLAAMFVATFGFLILNWIVGQKVMIDVIFNPYSSGSYAFATRIFVFIIVFSFIIAFSSLLGMAFLFQREMQSYRRYRRWGRLRLEEMLIEEKPEYLLHRLKNRLIDAPDAAGSYVRAIQYVDRELNNELYPDLSPTDNLNQGPHP